MTDDDLDDADAGDSPLANPREELFARCYADFESDTFGNCTQSAIAAGYPEKYARTSGWKLIRRPRVLARIQALQSKNLPAEGEVVADLKHVFKKAMAKGDLSTACRAAELLGKRLAMFRDVAVVPTAEIAELTEAERAEAERVAALLVGQAAGPTVISFPADGTGMAKEEPAA